MTKNEYVEYAFLLIEILDNGMNQYGKMRHCADELADDEIVDSFYVEQLQLNVMKTIKFLSDISVYVGNRQLDGSPMFEAETKAFELRAKEVRRLRRQQKRGQHILFNDNDTVEGFVQQVQSHPKKGEKE
ncbi:MAG: hypothetical protein ACYC69_16460 [Thermodesulfovibrionales bacterium]